MLADDEEAEAVTQALVGSVFERLVRANLSSARLGAGGLEELLPDGLLEVGPAVHAPDASWPWSAAQGQVPPPPSSDGDVRRDEPEPAHDWTPPGASADPADSLPTAVVATQKAVAELLAAPVSGRPPDVAAVLTLAEQLRGLGLRALAEMDATGSHLPTGAASAATWLRDTQLLSDPAAHAQLRLAAVLREELPQVDRQLCQGRTTVEHARAAAAGTRGLDPRIVADSQDAICALLASTDPQTAHEQLRERAEALNPELGRAAERRAHARRGLTADPVPSGLLLGGSLGVDDGQILLLGLDLAVQADRTDGDTRSLRQRRADTLLCWARQAATAAGGEASSVAEDLRTTRTHLLLTCTAQQLTAARTWLDGIGAPTDAGPAQPGSAEDITGPSRPWNTAGGRQHDRLHSRTPAGAPSAPAR